MAYEVYTKDVEESRKYSVPNTSIEENCARTGARRVAWAVVHWWREEAPGSCLADCPDQCPCKQDLSDSLQKVLEQEAPD